MQASEPVTLVFSANDYYAPYLDTLITSIMAHRTDDRAYDIVILSEDMQPKSQETLRRHGANKGVTVTFYDVTEAMRPYQDKLYIEAHFKVETYFRLLLPQILPSCHKALYLDADMICNSDVAELYDTNVDGYLIAACRDPDTTGLYNGSPLFVGLDDYRAYMDDILRLKRPFDYFQAGTILFNLDAWRESIQVEEVFEFAQSYNWHLLDQDVLNHVCEGRVRFLDMSWNVMYDFDDIRIPQIISYTTDELKEAYFTARRDPKIVHYAGPIKPWDKPESDFAPTFWRYARQSPYYEVILRRMALRDDARLERELQAVREEVDNTRRLLDETRRALDDMARNLEGMQGRMASVETLSRDTQAELTRFEQRPVGLMLKEFTYQKALKPLVHLVTRDNVEAREKLYALYRKVHPARQ